MASVRTATLRVFGLGNIPSPALSIYRSSFQRPFSATAASLRVTGPIPTFKPTSNPELDSLLEKIRHDYFFPIRLSQLHYRLMYRKRNHARLADDPLTVEVEGEQYTLTPQNSPPGASQKEFKQALELMKEPSDYDALPGLLLGFSQVSTTPISVPRREKVARRLNQAGRTDVLMEIARNAGELKFWFSACLAREFMRALRKAQAQAPVKKDATKALRNSVELLEIVGKREICFDQEKRLNDDNVILGTVLSMFADTSLKYNDGKDFEGNTKNYVLKLKSVWTGPEAMELVDAKGIKSKTKAKGYVYKARGAVRDWTPVLEGILQAKSMLAGSELSPWLEETSERLAGNIAYWREFVERNTLECWGEDDREPLEG